MSTARITASKYANPHTPYIPFSLSSNFGNVEFNSALAPWEVTARILYNPSLEFVNYVVPGVVGLILQLVTVTLIASTITREREAGTLSQLLVTPLQQSEIVIGKVLPYLFVSLFLIASTIEF